MKPIEDLKSSLLTRGNYSFVVTTTIILSKFITDFSFIFLTLMNPNINSTQSSTSQLQFTSWSNDYNLNNNPLKTSLITTIYISGLIFGLILLNFFLNSNKKEQSIKFFLIIFCISTIFIWIPHFEALLLMLFLQGACHIIINILVLIIVDDFYPKTRVNNKVILIILISTIAGILSLITFKNLYDYRIVYSILSVFSFATFLFALCFIVNSPFPFFFIGDKEEVINSMTYIATFNNLIINDNSDENNENQLSLTDDVYEDLINCDYNQMEKDISFKEHFLVSKTRISYLVNKIVDSLIYQENYIYDENIQNDQKQCQKDENECKESIFTIFITFLFYTSITFITFFNAFEVEYYRNHEYFIEIYVLTFLFGFCLFLIWRLYEQSIGKFNIVVFSLVIIFSSRLLFFLHDFKNFYILLYCIERSFSMSFQLLCHSIISSIYYERERVILYSCLSIIGQFVLFFIPFIMNYYSYAVQSYTYLGIVSFGLLIIIILNATLKKSEKSIR